ncbi:MAG: STAS domain-containing protein [Deltaproteobacteria bacterium]|nr:STAS domain-containing protein [Deltaproteobacteria bacterium]
MEVTNSYTATTHLLGDWTIVGVVQQAALLTELQFLRASPGATVVIDCSGIDGIDLSGFQLLYVWLHCIQLSGVRPKLVNMPDWMRDAQERLGIMQVFENEQLSGRRLADGRWGQNCREERPGQWDHPV